MMDRNARSELQQHQSKIKGRATTRAAATQAVEYFKVLTSPEMLETTERLMPELLHVKISATHAHNDPLKKVPLASDWIINLATMLKLSIFVYCVGGSALSFAYFDMTGGGALIVDKYRRAVEEAPVPPRSTDASSTAEATSTATSTATPGQRRPAASEVTSAAKTG